MPLTSAAPGGAAAEQRNRPRDRALVVVGEIVERGDRVGNAATRLQGKRIEAALQEVVDLVAEDVADGAQFSAKAVLLAQQPRTRVAAPVAELRKIDRDQTEAA